MAATTTALERPLSLNENSRSTVSMTVRASSNESSDSSTPALAVKLRLSAS
ncbi:MAG: hypothetical protein JNK85_10185 [Verrucomicrobiales bacterium]|nr:hypothetical protein [Verrucomicrobiales bacterium]